MKTAGNNKFNGERLKEALRFRAKKMTELADETGISKQSLSLYANNENVPPYDNVRKIARTLNFPVDYFLTEDRATIITDDTYFRSQVSATKMAQASQRVKVEYVGRLYEVLLKYVDLPDLDLPQVTFNGTDDPFQADSDETILEIEHIADTVREKWNLGREPIDNLQYAIQSHGIVLTGFPIVDPKIDAFSQRMKINGKLLYVIALALGTRPIQRLRFDMAHELGHILMHTWDESNDNLEKSAFNTRETQANIFAGALLLPRDTFSKDITPYAIDIDYYRHAKKKWGVSMQAMMFRARQLKIITPNQFTYMMRQVSKNGWRTKEPGDIEGKLTDTIFQGALDILFDGGYLSPRDVKIDFARQSILLSDMDLEELMGLRQGMLNVDEEKKVIPFRVRTDVLGRTGEEKNDSEQGNY